MVKQCVKKKGLNMAFMCTFLSLTIYRCLIKITESEFSRRKTEEKIEKLLLFFFFVVFYKNLKKKILTLNHYEQVICQL